MRTRTPIRCLLLTLAVLMLIQSFDALQAQSVSRATDFKLPNGMQFVVVPDNRAPVITHMVWYRVGGADEPPGSSGIAHFLEHLMFKATEKIPTGEFSKIVARLGGQDNAFTSHDATAYFQRISKDRLRTIMQMEADRMQNLKLEEKEVLTERDVILEERRSRIDNNPSSVLDEQMSAALYQNHPYGVPVIGWMHEIAKLSREDALSYYKRYYAPNNAILVVSGDVTPDEVKALATEIFSPLKPSDGIKARARPKEPEHRAARRLELKDPRAGKSTLTRYYLAPSYITADKGDGEALDLLMKITAQGSTSRLYQKLVVEDKIASSASGWYSGSGLDSGKIAISAVAADGFGLDKIEAAMDAVIADVKAKGVTEEELTRAKKLYMADFVYESDSQSTLARRYGWGLVVGRTISEIDAWPKEIQKVTREQIQSVAQKYLEIRRSVTGTLLPVAPESDSAQPVTQPKRS
jgi:zinc protease